MQLLNRYHGSRSDGSRFADRIFRAFRSAQPASGAAGQVASSVQELRKPLPRHRYTDIDRRGAARHFHGPDLFGTCHESLAQREANCEVLEIRRRCEHHDVWNAVIDQCDRNFLRDLVGGGGGDAACPAPDGNLGADGLRGDGRRSFPRNDRIGA